MKYYFAGVEQNPFYKMLIASVARKYLMSFFYVMIQRGTPLVMTDLDDTKEIMIDSGGYSAREAFKVINVDDYMRFLDAFKLPQFHGTITRCFNLDGHSLSESLNNQKILEDGGYNPLPIYHWSEYAGKDRDILDDWIKKYDYIAAGGVANMGLKKKQKEAFYNYIFFRTRDKVKVHGLGMSSVKPCEKYPFATVDSTTWLQWQKFAVCRSVEDPRLQKVMARQLHYRTRNWMEIIWYLNFEIYITKLWAARGVKWDDYDEVMENEGKWDISHLPDLDIPFYKYNPDSRRFDQTGEVIKR